MRRRVESFGGRRGKVLCVGALAVCLVRVSLAAGPDPVAEPRYLIEQPSQGLAETLRAIARQTGVSVLFDPGVVGGRVARPVSGRLSAAEAISAVLKGTGLAAEVMKDGAIVVRPVSAPAPQVTPTPLPDPAGHHTAVQPVVAAPAPAASDAGGPSATSAAQELQTIEVTGSRLKRIAAEGPLPVNTYTSRDIDRSGQPTLERFLSSLNEVSVSQGEGTFGPMSGQASVQLRGLPLGSTLVLINGRRVEAVGSSSANFFNLDLIPLAAIERIEVVPVGSSAVYGGDALAGVVNIILKKSLDGFSLNARLGSGKGTSDGGISLATGGEGEQGSFLVVGSYSKSTPLTMADRGFFLDGDYRRFGGPDARTQDCTPGTVSSTTTGNLPGLNSTFAGIPSAPAGQPLTVASFIPTAGQPNLCNSLANGHGYALVFGHESFGLHASAERRLGPTWSVFGELTHAKQRDFAQEDGLTLDSVVVPASSFYNPFGVPVNVTAKLGLQNGAQGLVRDTNYTRALVGLRGDLWGGWDFEASVATSRDDGTRVQLNNTVDTAALTAALASPTAAAALDPFSSGVAASADVLHGIWSDAVRENHGRKDQASAFVRGPVFHVPAGSIDAIAGVEFAHDRYETYATGSDNSVGSRTSSAMYGEMRIPLLHGGTEDAHGWELATLTLAGRYDRYSDFGGATTHQAGLEVRPLRSLLLRGATATSFKPPTLLETSVDDMSFPIDLFGLVDPARGNTPIVSGTVLRTTNQHLQPERGRAWSLGALWEPEDAPGARLGINAWHVRIDGLISLLWPQDVLDNESLFPGFVTRGPSVGGTPGPVTQLLYSEVNFGSLETAGIDFEAARSWRAAGGQWTVSASATRTTQYDVAISPGLPAESRLGVRAPDYWAPKWKGRAGVGFEQGTWGLGLTSRYLGAYQDSGAESRSLGNYWLHDLSGQLNLKALGLAFGTVKAATLSLAVANLTDRQPEFVSTSPYYDVTQADWRGRYVSLRLSVDW